MQNPSYTSLGKVSWRAPTLSRFDGPNSVFAIGIVTLQRMKTRNKRTDEWKIRMDMVRNQFAKREKPLEKYKPFEGDDVKNKVAELGSRKLSSGGLYTMVLAMDYLIAFGCLWSLSITLSIILGPSIFITLIAAIPVILLIIMTVIYLIR